MGVDIGLGGVLFRWRRGIGVLKGGCYVNVLTAVGFGVRDLKSCLFGVLHAELRTGNIDE